jgi:trehalose 6-phosphate synthase/phosphatase
MQQNVINMSSQRLIIVANRLPYQYKERAGTLSRQLSSGGLVSSMVSYLQCSGMHASKQSTKALWIGTADIPEKKFNSFQTHQTGSDNSFDVHPVFLPEALKNKFYQGFSNDCIWPLFHYFPSYAQFMPDYYDAYVKANEFFLNKIVEVYQPGDVIWIHDYHLMLLPGMLRKALPEATIGFFLHIPFPSFEIMRIMPNAWRKEILNGLLGADLIGFHTSDYMRYFLHSVQHILGCDVAGRKIHSQERVITVDAFPVSIDFKKFYFATNTDHVFEEKNNIRKKMNGRQVIISVDRLDYSKAIVNRLEAFELFLKQHPGYHGKVTYILLMVPSREILTKYKENKQETERLVSNINGKYGNIDWTPVVYQYKSVDFAKLAGLYFSADVALITPVRDGMNLVAKEFVSTRIDKRGVLILSETAGAAAELKEAIIVNPTDRQEISDAIFQALNMPVEEQVSRNESMQARIRNYDVVKWADDFITQLNLQKSSQGIMKIKELTPQIEKTIIEHYTGAGKKLILLDYDGTLAPFAKLPHLAVPSQKLKNLLTNLATETGNDVVLISGRKRESLESWFSDLPINLVAEHGAYIRKPGGQWLQLALASANWKEKVLPVLDYFCNRCPGSFIEEKSLSLAWHYRNADKEFGAMRAKELLNELNELSEFLSFQVLEGNMVVEVRTSNINKGIAAKHWMESQHYDFIIAIGDDKTDEDMFKMVPENGYSIRVGLTQSHAGYNIRNQEAVLRFLHKLQSQLTEVQ